MSNFGTFGVPDPGAPLGYVAGKEGEPDKPVRLADVWYRWVTRISQISAESPIIPVTIGPSPFAWTADNIGHLNINSGTVSLRTLTRGKTTINVTTSTIPVAAGDVVTITYSVAPTITFIPDARA